MPELKLQFQLQLTRDALTESIGEPGPLFHRWLPDGKNDAITLTRPEEQQQIVVWFERRLDVNHGFLRWRRNGGAFDPNLIRRQYKIAAGPLFGEMNAVVSKDELVAIKRHPIKVGAEFGAYDPESPEYVEAGKRIVDKIQQRAGRLVSTLRTQYGQYWLDDILPWDSRRMSLGSYCGSVAIIPFKNRLN